VGCPWRWALRRARGEAASNPHGDDLVVSKTHCEGESTIQRGSSFTEARRVANV
jgi:hypothetical protein